MQETGFGVATTFVQSYPPGTEALAPPPPSPCPASLTPRPPSQLFSLCLPSQPFPDPFPWIRALGLPPRPPGQLRWVPPPPHRASFKKGHFLLFVRVRNNKNTTHVVKFAPSLGPVPLPPTPPEPKPMHPPPSPCPASLTPRPPSQLCGWVPSTRPAPVGSPPTPQGILQIKPFFFFLYALETTKIRHTLRNLLRPWGPCPYHLPPRNRSPCTPPEPLPRLPDPPSTKPALWVGTPSPGIKALGLPPPPSTRPAPVGTPPQPHRASFK